MKLDAQCEAELLKALGAEAVGLLCGGDIGTLANRFGYALSYGRDTATAIRADLAQCLVRLGARSLAAAPGGSVRSVRFYEPNSSSLLAVIACLAPTDNGTAVLVELVVTSNGSEKHITLEDISAPDVEAR